MIIGFTGTQKGMNPSQTSQVRKLLSQLMPDTIHHGGCIGADKEFHDMASKLKIEIVLHPPIIKDRQAVHDADTVWPEKSYLERNKDIVESSDMIIACPAQRYEVRRSGTWSTIRYARSLGIPCTVITIY